MVAEVTFLGIVWFIVAGLVIGVLARLILPGKQRVGIVATMVLGVIAAIIGGLLWNAVFPNNDGVAWIGSIVVAVALLWIYAGLMGSRRAERSR